MKPQLATQLSSAHVEQLLLDDRGVSMHEMAQAQ